MGKTALKSLLDSLGRRTTRVVKYEKAAILESSAAMAIDGHAIGSCSDENDLGEGGYKFNHLKEDQVNLLMGYDINTRMPLFARMYRGSCNDKSFSSSTVDSTVPGTWRYCRLTITHISYRFLPTLMFSRMR